MPRICYVDKKFSASSRELIDHANDIIDEYWRQGFDLTLRQLYYQFVSRDLIANDQKEYKRLGSVINDARLAGEIDWESIIDRTRNLERLSDWKSPADIVVTCSRQFRFDKWEDQEYRVEVWIEKDALIGVIEGVCKQHQVPYFSCRGYTSQSEMWAASQRLIRYREDRQEPVIIHLGDHDPSGIDMTRDITDRLDLFMGAASCQADVRRIALNMDQVRKYKPPPNPAKVTDSRAEGYIKQHGNESWELDALEPQVMAALIRKTIRSVRDEEKWRAQIAREELARDRLLLVAHNWDRIQELAIEGDWYIDDGDGDDGDDEDDSE